MATSTLAPEGTSGPPLPGPAPTDPVTGTIWAWSDDSAMVYVPAGTFWMGSDEGDADAQSNEIPQHQVTLDAFWFDRTMVTNAQYRRCVDDGVCSPPDRFASQIHNNYYGAAEFDDYPVIYVDWEQADEYCTWVGKRLPTEAEWEKAARGTDRRIYPWGNEFDGSLANFCDLNCGFGHRAAEWDDGYTDTSPVGNYPGNASPYGALDMAGNLWEWVADWYKADYYGSSPERNPQGPASGNQRAKRGGAWGDRQQDIRSATRHALDPAISDGSVGFRCARAGSEPSRPVETAMPASTPQAGATRVWEKDGAVMVHVPAGTFWMGSDEGDSDAYDDERPQHEVRLNAFWIDRTEVTNAQYRRCVSEGACDPPRGSSSYTRDSYYGVTEFDDHPVIYVDWEQANAYCTWAGKRLPTEAEWEKAARGTDKRIYPWGNEFDGSLANFCDVNCGFDHNADEWDDGYTDTAPVGNYPGNASPYGALDMAGNVWEWVADWHAGDYYATSPDRNPQGPDSGEWRVLRGGSWLDLQGGVRAAARDLGGPSGSSDDLGFRCARSGSEP
jgi:formylglycine-generating enzyme required for sulfatase activity